jgi:hypothetical protein
VAALRRSALTELGVAARDRRRLFPTQPYSEALGPELRRELPCSPDASDSLPRARASGRLVTVAAFAAAWNEAYEQGTERLELVAQERAINGSDLLLIFLLKGRGPTKYRDSVRHEVDARLTVSVEDAREQLERRLAAIEERRALPAVVRRLRAEETGRPVERGPPSLPLSRPFSLGRIGLLHARTREGRNRAAFRVVHPPGG